MLQRREFALRLLLECGSGVVSGVGVSSIQSLGVGELLISQQATLAGENRL